MNTYHGQRIMVVTDVLLPVGQVIATFKPFDTGKRYDGRREPRSWFVTLMCNPRDFYNVTVNLDEYFYLLKGGMRLID